MGTRHYAQGDRVLLHTKAGRAGVHNGSVGTVVAVDDAGLRVAFDEAGEVSLARALVAGRRGDGNPNLSHGWCRSVEGAQGGTWEAVHLLGTASLDALVGYAGQSRGRAPTHTWNTRPLVVADHGGQPADRRDATEVVLAGLSREPVVSFAAADDPWILHRRLSAERDEHLGVLAGAPPNPGGSLVTARAGADRDGRTLTGAGEELARASERLGRLGPLTGLRRGGRAERAHAESALARANESWEAARGRHVVSGRRVAGLEAAAVARARFDAEQAWRVERVGEIDDALDRHWAGATLAAVRQHDPLAFGIERLRAARASAAADLDAYRAGLPPDRSTAVAEAKRRLGECEQGLRQARAGVEERRGRLEAASERHWGRRDVDAVRAARLALDRAEDAVEAAEEAQRLSRVGLDTEEAGQAERVQALAVTEPERAALAEGLGELDAALDDTRPERVAALAGEAIVPAHLVAVVGEAPADPAARRVWCGLVQRIESYRDRHPEALGHEEHGGVVAAIGPRQGERWVPHPEWDELAGQLRVGIALVAAAEVDCDRGDAGVDVDARAWAEVLDRAVEVVAAQHRAVGRESDRDHGISIGW